MYCVHCGSKYEKGSKYCQRCGWKFDVRYAEAEKVDLRKKTPIEKVSYREKHSRLLKPRIISSLAFLIFIIVILLIYQYYRTAPISMVNRKIGVNVSVSGDEVPANIKATEEENSELPLTEIEALGPAVRISPEGELSKPVKLHFSLNQQVDNDFTTVIATKKTNDSEWEFLTPVISEDGQTATVETRHFSIWMPFRLFVLPLRPSKKFQDEVKASFTSELFEKAKKPECQGEKEARQENFTITSSTGGALHWCFGIENGKRILKVVNRKRYPLDILHPGLRVIKPQPVLLELKQLTRLGSGEHTVLFPREEIVYTVELIEQTQSAGVGSSFSPRSGEAVRLAGLEAAIDAYFSIIPKLKAKEVLTSKEKYKMINKALTAKKCIKSWQTRNMGELLVDCLTADVLDELGPNALVMPAIKSIISLSSWFTSFVSSTVDSYKNDAEYQIITSQKIPADPLQVIDPETTDITGKSVDKNSGMPCPEPTGSEGQANIGYWLRCGASFFDVQ